MVHQLLFLWMKANHAPISEILLRNWRSNKNEHCDAHVPALRNLHTWTVPRYIYRLLIILAGIFFFRTKKKLARLLFTRLVARLMTDILQTIWKFNANLEKLHPGRTHKKKNRKIRQSVNRYPGFKAPRTELGGVITPSPTSMEQLTIPSKSTSREWGARNLRPPVCATTFHKTLSGWEHQRSCESFRNDSTS